MRIHECSGQQILGTSTFYKDEASTKVSIHESIHTGNGLLAMMKSSSLISKEFVEQLQTKQINRKHSKKSNLRIHGE